MQNDRTREPTYEGRRFDRPEEELTDQGLRFDVATLLSRRNLLRAVGPGATVATLAACGADAPTSATPVASSSTSTTGEIPDETAGPYPGSAWLMTTCSGTTAAPASSAPSRGT